MTAIDLRGATVVVTGASRGFGRATAVALAESGAHVVGVARHGGLEELRRELGDALSCETGDVADPGLPARLFGTYRPAAVVLNAGATPMIAPLDENDWDTFSVHWNVDVRQAFHFDCLHVLTLRGGEIEEVMAFRTPAVFPSFDLPASIAA